MDRGPSILATASVCVAALCASHRAGAQDTQPARTLVVAIRDVAPFALPADDGQWQGIAIELWNEIARELGATTEFRAVEIQELIDGLADGTFDAAAAPVSMTADREERIDFTHPFFNAGLGIAVRAKGGSTWWSVARSLISLRFLEAVGTLAVVLLLAGVLVYAFERRRNQEQFGGGPLRGLGNSFWWSAVTMTTVGYGDKAPVTLGGRVVALVWMFVSIVVISGLTAGIASALTVSQLDTGMRGPEDLPGLRVATVEDSTSEDYLRRVGASISRQDSPEAALAALDEERVDAVVYDAPILRYLANTQFEGRVRVIGREFEPQNYAFGLPPDEPQRETINQVILRETAEPSWRELVKRYMHE